MDMSTGHRATAAIGLLLAAAAGGLYHARRRQPAAMSYAGRTVLITGGARGLGLALARRFAREGARLALVSRTPAELERARIELQAAGAEVWTFACDIRDPVQIDALVANVVAMAGGIDVVVNNAGVIQMMPFAHATDDDFQDSLETYFWGPLHLVRAALPHLRPGRGQIVNITSIGGRIAVPHLSPYCVGKFALVALSDALHAELGRDGISVVTVVPGLMRTGSHRNVKLRGRHESEAIWFGAASATPLTSMAVERAAAHIVDACRARRARVTVGLQARLAELANVLTPEFTSSVSRLVARLLPSPATSAEGNAARWSRDLDLGLVASLLPWRAAARMNQPVAADEAG